MIFWVVLNLLDTYALILFVSWSTKWGEFQYDTWSREAKKGNDLTINIFWLVRFEPNAYATLVHLCTYAKAKDGSPNRS